MNRSALLASLFIAVIGVALLVFYRKRFEQHTAGGPTVAVLAAAQDIPLGTIITERMLTLRSVREAYVESRHVPASDVSRIVGVPVSMEVKANESILWSDLAIAAGERRDLSSLVKTGMRAMTIHTDSTSTFGGLLRPGDRIDAFYIASRGGERDATATVPLVQNVVVLAVGSDTGEAAEGRPDGRVDTDSQVTLGVTLSQAQTLALALDRGRLTLALRNPEDITLVGERKPTTMASVLAPERTR